MAEQVALATKVAPTPQPPPMLNSPVLAEIEFSVTVPGPWFCKLRLTDTEVAPTAVSENATVAAPAQARTGMGARTPVPNSATMCGEPGALETTDTWPL